jgi:hypothetical protein
MVTRSLERAGPDLAVDAYRPRPPIWPSWAYRATTGNSIRETGAAQPTPRSSARTRRVKRGRFQAFILGSYRIATAPEPYSNRLTSFKSTCLDSPANNVGP